MSLRNRTELPAAEDAICYVVPVLSNQPAAADRELIVSAKREQVGDVYQIQTVLSLRIIGILVVVIRAGRTACTVVALVIGEAAAEGVVRDELQTVAGLLAERRLQCVVV